MPLLSILFALSLSTAVPPADLGDALCTPRMQIEQPAACPAVGPGMYAAEFAAASLPAAVPELPLAPLERYDPVVPFKYAKVVTPEALRAGAREVRVLYHLDGRFPEIDPLETQWSVVEGDVRAGDRVIVSNLDSLHPGSRVRVGDPAGGSVSDKEAPGGGS